MDKQGIIEEDFLRRKDDQTRPRPLTGPGHCSVGWFLLVAHSASGLSPCADTQRNTERGRGKELSILHEELVRCFLTTRQLIKFHCRDYASADRNSTSASLCGHLSICCLQSPKSRARDFYILLLALVSFFLEHLHFLTSCLLSTVCSLTSNNVLLRTTSYCNTCNLTSLLQLHVSMVTLISYLDLELLSPAAHEERRAASLLLYGERGGGEGGGGEGRGRGKGSFQFFVTAAWHYKKKKD